MGYLAAVRMDGVSPHTPTSRGKTIAALALAFVLGIFLAACGGGDNGDQTTSAQTQALPAGLTTTPVPDTLTKQEYLARGDQICEAGAFKVGNAARQQFPSGVNSAEIQPFTQQTVVPVYQDQVNELRALPPPAGDAQTVEAIYDALQRGINQLRGNPALFADPNAHGIFDEASRLARAYGFTQCGQR